MKIKKMVIYLFILVLISGCKVENTSSDVCFKASNEVIDDGKLRYGFMIMSGKGMPSTGHFLAYIVDREIPLSKETIDISLFIGHIKNIKHFYWNDDGKMQKADEERLKFSIELVDRKNFSSKYILVESIDYLSEDFNLYFEFICYSGEVWEKKVFNKQIDVQVPTAEIINDNKGESLIRMVMEDEELGKKESFNDVMLQYKIIEDKIIFYK